MEKRSCAIFAALMVVLAITGVTEAATLYLRDGWDIVNNVADAGGYSGTMDDTGHNGDWSTPSSPGGGTYAGAEQLYAYLGGKLSAAIMDFDLSGVSQLAGADVTSATLKVTLSTANWFKGGTFQVREVDHAWIEDEANFWRCNTAGNIWNNWSDGMRMDGPTLDTYAAPGGNVNRAGTVMEFDVTSLVEGWVESGNTQLGFAVSYVSGSLTDNAYFAGKDYATVSYRPMLEIDYVPEPATMVLFGIGGIAMLRRKNR